MPRGTHTYSRPRVCVRVCTTSTTERRRRANVATLSLPATFEHAVSDEFGARSLRRVSLPNLSDAIRPVTTETQPGHATPPPAMTLFCRCNLPVSDTRDEQFYPVHFMSMQSLQHFQVR